MSVPHTSVVEQAQRRLRETLDELRAAAATETSADRFYHQWLATLVEAMAADGGQCRRWHDGAWVGVQTIGPEQTDVDEAEQARLAATLDATVRSRAPQVRVGPTRTTIFYPLSAAGELRGVARLDLAIETEAAQRGCLKFIAEAAEAVERFHLFADRREALRRAADGDDERRLTAAAHAALDLEATAFALANEGRLLVGCDRLSVLRRRGTKYRLLAVSGQDDVNRRTAAVRSLEDVTRRAAATGEPLAFPNRESELDDQLTAALEAYLDERHVKRLVIMPLIEPAADQDDANAPTDRREPFAAIMAEYFGDHPPQVDERRRLEITARTATAALRNAVEYDALFLLPVWRTLGRFRQACFAPGTRVRTWLILGGLVACLAALVFVQIENTVYCRGALNPAERRRVFAPLDGIVSRVAVKHGDRVAAGQTLVELRNTDLDLAEAEVAGRRTSAAEQLLAVERSLFNERKGMTAEEVARLSGERSRLREELAALDRQLELHAAKRRQLVVVSPIDGEVTTWSADDLLENRPVRQGQQLLTVADVNGPWELELRVPDERSGRLVDAARTAAEPLAVTFSPAVDPGVVRLGKVIEIQNSAELRGDDGNTVQVRVAIAADELPQRRPGAEAAAHIHCGRRSAGYVWLSDAYAFVRSKVLFRWF